MDDFSLIKRYLDKENCLKIWPSKQNLKILVLKYLSTKFDLNKFYSEKEVNEILKKWSLFEDYVLLRRELFEAKILDRRPDCTKYWKIT